MKEKQKPISKILYNKLNVFLYFLLGIISFFLPIILMLLKLSEIKQLVFPLILIIIAGYFYYRIFKSFIHIIIGKPMIEFTTKKYIDNLNGISIKWNDINRIYLEKNKATFIVFLLNNDSRFYNDLNILKRTFYKFEGSGALSFKTNLTFAKGRNNDILIEIENNYKINKK